ncbi:MAG: aldo/keto reductase [Bacteroidales bacterium]|nr:aldo/keto reductase [Bacteroidales bacterium]
MKSFNEPVMLGRTGLKVGRLGITSSYGAPAAAFEEAFERGCNYFTLGTFMKGRSNEMISAVQNISGNGQREKLVINLMEYTHSRWLGKRHFYKGLEKLGLEYVDVLMLGYYPNRPRKQVLDLAAELKEKGVVRHLALSGHNRRLFPKLREEGLIDIFQVRYNAVNSGAEQDVFPYTGGENRPGMITFTATRWGQLLKESKMPPGEKSLTAQECYRFVLSNPSVDVCMTGARSLEMMRENLETLDTEPLSPEEMERIRRIGDHIYGKPRA